MGRFITDTVLALRSLRNGFQGDNIRLRSAALTYISVFSLVPLLTVARLEFKDILGFLLLAFLLYFPFVTAAFFLFG